MSSEEKIRVATVYPDDMTESARDSLDIVHPRDFSTLPAMFRERVRRSPDGTAYFQYQNDSSQWRRYDWLTVSNQVDRWRSAFNTEPLNVGDRVGILAPNSILWVQFDQAALAQGLVVVPMYKDDRADNVSYILDHTETKILFVQSILQWQAIKQELGDSGQLNRVIVLDAIESLLQSDEDELVYGIDQWLALGAGKPCAEPELEENDLATIVYTSGTTGKPKGVMLSHKNMLSNAYSALQSVVVYPEDRFVSFLPLSHMFERTVGYYLTMMSGASVAFNRSIPELMEDIVTIRPTALITVPRIFEKAHATIKSRLELQSGIKKSMFALAVEVGWCRFNFHQGRMKWHPKLLLWPLLDRFVAHKIKLGFGGSLRFIICGGAKLSPAISKLFISLGIDILQGYGLTETSPVLSTNTVARNRPETIGLPLRGAQLRLGDHDELLAKGPFVMAGYWRNPEATDSCFDSEGWFSTGDVASISSEGFISITGRIKEIIVLANGEKIPPADMESAISESALFEQVLVVGEGRPYLTALIVVNSTQWNAAAIRQNFDPDENLNSKSARDFALNQIAELLSHFPGYAFIRNVTLMTEEWTVENGLITPTLKPKRPVLLNNFKPQIDSMYDES